jgi:hypothetical protein
LNAFESRTRFATEFQAKEAGPKTKDSEWTLELSWNNSMWLKFLWFLNLKRSSSSSSSSCYSFDFVSLFCDSWRREVIRSFTVCRLRIPSCNVLHSTSFSVLWFMCVSLEKKEVSSLGRRTGHEKRKEISKQKQEKTKRRQQNFERKRDPTCDSLFLWFLFHSFLSSSPVFPIERPKQSKWSVSWDWNLSRVSPFVKERERERKAWPEKREE